MSDSQLISRLRNGFDNLVLAGADGADFYRLALQINPDISPMEINDEIIAALARWQDAERRLPS
ncbi:hypothetical protein NKI15_20000 [Mesorhizobium sp. M0862]|uniref:hypothetical protein n=1 Tax=Mesorhizobium sp. M0862 TaxID=2957015 RepID=UPI003339D2DE